MQLLNVTERLKIRETMLFVQLEKMNSKISLLAIGHCLIHNTIIYFIYALCYLFVVSQFNSYNSNNRDLSGDSSVCIS